MTLPYFQVDTRNEHLKTLAGKHGSLWNEFNQKVDVSWIYHDHGLEGVVLLPNEISAALNNKVISDSSFLPMYHEIKNLSEAIQAIRGQKEKNRRERLSKSFLQSCYDLLIRRVRGVPEGNGIRKEDGRYGAYYHKSCPHQEVEAQLKKLFSEINSASTEDIHPMALTARFHHRFMQIMPYGRFSGKLARLFSALLLMRYDYPPAIIHSVERARYYECLMKPDESDLLVLLSESVKVTVESGLQFIERGVLERRRKREARKKAAAQKKETSGTKGTRVIRTQKVQQARKRAR